MCLHKGNSGSKSKGEIELGYSTDVCVSEHWPEVRRILSALKGLTPFRLLLGLKATTCTLAVVLISSCFIVVAAMQPNCGNQL